MNAIHKFILVVTCVKLVYIVKANDLSFIHPQCDEFEDTSDPTLLPHPNDCNKFYKCAGGYAFTLSCPKGLHWNVDKNWCDFPWEAKCKLTNNITSTTTVKTLTTKNYTNTPIVKCRTEENPLEPEYYPYPGDCRKFFKCKSGKAFPLNCPFGLEWSVELNRCEWPDIANCVGKTRPITETSSEISIKSTNSLEGFLTTSVPLIYSNEIVSAICQNVTLAYKAYPGNCTRYIRCERGYGSVYNCPGDLYFNSRMGVCDQICG